MGYKSVLRPTDTHSFLFFFYQLGFDTTLYKYIFDSYVSTSISLIFTHPSNQTTYSRAAVPNLATGLYRKLIASLHTIKS